VEPHDSIVKCTLAVLRRHFATLWAAAAWPHITVALCYLLVGAFLRARQSTNEGVDAATMWQSMGAWQKLLIFSAFVVTTALPYGLAVAGVSALVWKDSETGNARLRDAFSAVCRHFGRLVLLSVGIGVVGELGAVVVIPPMLVLVFCAFAIPILIIEGTGPLKAVRRSFSLSGQKIVAILGLRLTVFLVLILMLIVLFVVISPLSDAGLPWWGTGIAFWAIVASFASFAQMVEGTFITQLYIDIQERTKRPQPDVSAS
jgi:hypothetical protein